MRFKDNGAFYSVRVSTREVIAFNSRWPCSSLHGPHWFEFDKRNGDLVDYGGKGDGGELLALSQDAQAWAFSRMTK